MILTCPACATQYTVKDGAVPPGGRQVRCAACKHSWHQLPEGNQAGAPVETAIAPPPPDPADTEAPLAEVPEQWAAEGMIAEEPQPTLDEIAPDHRSDQQVTQESEARDSHAAGLDDYAPLAEALEVPPVEQGEDSFDGIPDMRDYDEEPRRGSGLRWLIGLMLLVIALVAAFWFLAPPELKARAGLAEAGATELELMLTTSDRQKLASGNELLAISGRIINPTDRELVVPPIKAELRNKTTRALVYRWTIPPPARSLPPRASADFNSAEVDIPEGGDELTVTLGGTTG